MTVRRLWLYVVELGTLMALAYVQFDISFACDMKGANSIGAPLERQQTSSWCWAATTKTVMTYQTQKNCDRGKERCDSARQCEIVMTKLGLPPNSNYCCEKFINNDLIIPPIDCYVGGWPDQVLALYNFDTLPVRGALDWQALTNEICLDRPFLYVMGRQGRGTHVRIVKGYSYTDPDPTSALNEQHEWVEVYDPNHTDFEFVQYDEFVGDLPGRRPSYGYWHVWDYANIHPLP